MRPCGRMPSKWFAHAVECCRDGLLLYSQPVGMSREWFTFVLGGCRRPFDIFPMGIAVVPEPAFLACLIFHDGYEDATPRLSTNYIVTVAQWLLVNLVVEIRWRRHFFQNSCQRWSCIPIISSSPYVQQNGDKQSKASKYSDRATDHNPKSVI